MKVYRFLKWSSSQLEESFNEVNNYKHLGLISPSYEYLCRYSHIYNDGRNTFGDETQMVKYFFLSLADTLQLACQEKSGTNFILEYDIPEETLRNTIGIGFYGNLRVEFAVPYKELFEQTAVETPFYTSSAINFYNAHLYEDNIATYDLYKNLESYLPCVPFAGIHCDNRLSIYPLFCFEPKNACSIEFNPQNLELYKTLYREIKNEREKIHNYQNKLSSIALADKELEFYNPNFPKNKLFDFNYPIIEEENQTLKRILR